MFCTCIDPWPRFVGGFLISVCGILTLMKARSGEEGEGERCRLMETRVIFKNRAAAMVLQRLPNIALVRHTSNMAQNYVRDC